MQHILFFPQVGCFSFHADEKKKKKPKTIIFGYSHASMESCLPGAYVFRIHGSSGFFDLLVQVENKTELELWCERFKRKEGIPFDTISRNSTAIEEWDE